MIARTVGRGFTKDLTRDCIRDRTKDFTRDCIRDITRDRTKDFTRDCIRDITRDFTRDHIRVLIDRVEPGLRDQGTVEILERCRLYIFP